MQRHRLSHALTLALAATILPAHARPADGHDAAADTLDRITVTAQKREQQVQEVPIAMTAYSGEFIQKLGVSGLGDLAGYVPGLQVQEQSPNNPGFVIRGITSDSGAANEPARVSIFQDGVSLSRSRGASVELFDMERVEVLRGPQGTLFGRAAEIGAVHLIQNKARDENSGRVRIGVGNHNQRLIEGYFNASLQPEGLFGRVAFSRESRDGAYENLSGGKLGGKDTSALRGSLGMQFGDAGRMDLILNYQQDRPPGTAFRSGTIPTREGGTDPWGRADLNRSEQLGLERKVYGATVLGQFHLNDHWSINTTSGWHGFRSTEQFDADGSQLPALEFAEIAEGRQWSHELRVNFDNGGRFAGFFGAGWFREEGSQRVDFTTDERSLLTLLMQDTGIRTQVSQLMWLMGALPPGVLFPKPPVLNPDGTPFLGLGAMLPPGLALNPRHTESFANDGSTTAWDVFADGTWSITDRFDLTAGVRWTRENIGAGYQGFPGNAPSLLGGLGTGTPRPGSRNILNLATNGRLGDNGKFDALVGRLAAHYTFGPALAVYGSWARGRRPEVLNVTPQGNETLPAEIVNSVEIGLKGALNQERFVYDVTAFRYAYSNFQTLRPNPAGAIPPFVPTNAGNATARGVELALHGRLLEGLTAFANFAWLDARFDERDDNGNPQAYAGNRFRLTPDRSGSVGLDWEVPFGRGSFYLRPSYTWQSKVYFEDDNSEALSQDAYGLLNLRLGLRFDDGRWDIGLWGNNLNGEKYLIDAGNTGRLFGTPTFVPGNPRLYGISASVKF
ncbi:TonB-dependent receptor [Lysobacter pythonis]|uniref:TonB-dependent receptor n=1 Tax=Solilutibacter pythonis TaxID=2483112 RepID=A0A3M2HQ54_9GAMM|nr:TonB-dependent receptor [Lysobacter pythonis]RMH89469.1 TonB-dependent receptor [Lysobacter pythonis]